METFSALQALCAGNLPVTGELPSQRPMTWSFDVFCNLRLNKRLSKQSWCWWFETLSRSLWRHCNAKVTSRLQDSLLYKSHDFYSSFHEHSRMCYFSTGYKICRVKFRLNMVEFCRYCKNESMCAKRPKHNLVLLALFMIMKNKRWGYIVCLIL